jgi:hypothetical protein
MLDIAVLPTATSLAPFFGLLQVLHPTQKHLRFVINIGDGQTAGYWLYLNLPEAAVRQSAGGGGGRSSEDIKIRGLSGLSNRQGQRTNKAKQLVRQFSSKRKTFRLILWKITRNRILF